MNKQRAAMQLAARGRRHNVRRLGVCFILVLLFVFQFPAAFAGSQKKQPTVYVCPMDPDVKSKKPGSCPKCGMTLMAASDEVPKKTDDNDATDRGDRAAVGSIPDVSVYDQDGRKLRFYAD